jgi:hypothetical protein
MNVTVVQSNVPIPPSRGERQYLRGYERGKKVRDELPRSVVLAHLRNSRIRPRDFYAKGYRDGLSNNPPDFATAKAK